MASIREVKNVVEGLEGADFSVMFDVRVTAGGDVRCGLLVSGQITAEMVHSRLQSSGLGAVVRYNVIVMSTQKLLRRAASRDPYVLEVLRDPSAIVCSLGVAWPRAPKGAVARRRRVALEEEPTRMARKEHSSAAAGTSGGDARGLPVPHLP